MAVVEDTTKEDIMNWVHRVEVPWTKREAVQGRGVCLGLTVANGNPILTKMTLAEAGWIKKMNGWVKKKLKEANMESFRWSSLQVNVNTVSRLHRDKNNEGPSLLMTAGDYRGGEFQVQGTKAVVPLGGLWTFNGKDEHCS